MTSNLFLLSPPDFQTAQQNPFLHFIRHVKEESAEHEVSSKSSWEQDVNIQKLKRKMCCPKFYHWLRPIPAILTPKQFLVLLHALLYVLADILKAFCF